MTTIDNRVVKISFDNSQFEKNANTSLSTIEKLKLSLNFKGASSGLKELETSAKNVNSSMNFKGATNSLNELSATVSRTSKSINFNDAQNSIQELDSSIKRVDVGILGTAVASVSEKFDLLGGVALEVFDRIYKGITDLAQNMVKAITIEPIKMGLEEYETQINAIQTIMANTQEAFSSQGFTEQQQLEVVNSKLDELNTYADKTIYNFTEMTRNIGTFTAAGVDIDTATNAIQGFSNAAAISGASSTDASRGMYQLSQALSAGVVKLMDWRSIENANMGGQVFRDQLLDTARTHNIAVDQMIAEEGSFRDSLAKGWLTAEIMTETLEKFTATTEGLTETQIENLRLKWAERGYNDAQIDNILKLGQTATDAATKVKTFSQLIDTLKEALQSGWTQSFEYIIGDFEQAKELWTGIYTTLEAYINKSSEARNAILKEWNESEGGRAALIEGLANAFKALLSVVEPVKKAFDNVFSGITAQHLITISSAFRDFTAKLILNKEQMDMIQRAFQGLFLVIKTVADIIFGSFKIAFNVVTSILSKFLPLGNGILNIFALIGDALFVTVNLLRKFQGYLASLYDILANVFSAIGEQLRGFFNTISQNIDLSPMITALVQLKDTIFSLESIEAVQSKLSNFFESFKGSIDSGGAYFLDAFSEELTFIQYKLNEITPSIVEQFNRIKDGSLSLSDALQNGFSSTGFPMLEKLKSVLTTLHDKFKEVVPLIKEKVDQIRSAIAGLTRGVVDEAKKYGGLDLAGVLGIGAFGIVIKKLYGIFKKIKGDDGGNGGLVEGLLEVKDAVVDTFSSIQTTLKAGTIFAIAVAIGVLAYSLTQVASIPTENLLGGLGAMTVLMVQMRSMMTTLDDLDGASVGRMMGTVTSLVILTFAIQSLAKSIKTIGDMTLESILKGLTVVSILLSEMMVIAQILSKQKGSLNRAGDAIRDFALATLLLVAPVKILGEMDRNALEQGVGSVAVLLGLLTAVAAIIGKSGFGVSAGAGLMFIATSLLMLYGAIQLYASIDWDRFIYGLKNLGLVLAALTASAGLIGLSGFSFSAGAGLIAMALSLYVMYGAIMMYSSIDLPTFASGLIKVGLALVALAGAAYLLGGSTLSVDDGLALMAVGAAITILAYGISILAGLPTLAVAASLAILLIALIAFGAVATVLAPAAPILMQFAIAIGIFALSAVAIAAALMLIVVALGAFGAAIIGFLNTASELIGPMIEAMTTFMNAAADGIRENQQTFIDALGNLILALLETLMLALTSLGEWFVNEVWPWILENGPAIIQGLIDGIVSLAGSLMEGAVMLGESFKAGLEQLWPWIQENGPAIVQGLVDGIISFVTHIAEAAGVIFDEFCKAMEVFWPWLMENGPRIVMDLVEGILGVIFRIGEVAADIVGRLLEGLGDGVEQMLEVGANFVQGFIDGILGGLGEVWNAACDVANRAWAAITGTLDEHSPSRVTYGGGENFTLGFINGILSLKDRAINETAGVALAVMDAFDSAIDSDYSPAITPVVDLSNVQNGIGSIGSMFDSIPNTYGINGSIEAQNTLNTRAMLSLESGADYGAILQGMLSIQADLARYNEMMSKLNIVMDTGTLVGQLTPGIDRQLGRNAMMAGRGVL